VKASSYGLTAGAMINKLLKFRLFLSIFKENKLLTAGLLTYPPFFCLFEKSNVPIIHLYNSPHVHV